MMQIVIEDSDKATILKLLVNEDINVLKQAYAYAKNLELYGVDVSEKWETVTHQSDALERAYIRGLEDQRNSDILRFNYANLDIPTVIDEAPTVQAVPISELKNLREEMGNITDIKTYHERNLIWTCLCMLDNLIESYEEEGAD